MSKFKVDVTRTYEYEIEIDENVWNEQALKDWSELFSKVENSEDVAKYFAEELALDNVKGLPKGIHIISKKEYHESSID